jgi:hypothetical protein
VVHNRPAGRLAINIQIARIGRKCLTSYLGSKFNFQLLRIKFSHVIRIYDRGCGD